MNARILELICANIVTLSYISVLTISIKLIKMMLIIMKKMQWYTLKEYISYSSNCLAVNMFM